MCSSDLVSYALINHDEIRPEQSILSGAPHIRGLDMQPDESLVMAEGSEFDIKPNSNAQNPAIEE